jgi:hypothetical protein
MHAYPVEAVRSNRSSGRTFDGAISPLDSGKRELRRSAGCAGDGVVDDVVALVARHRRLVRERRRGAVRQRRAGLGLGVAGGVERGRATVEDLYDRGRAASPVLVRIRGGEDLWSPTAPTMARSPSEGNSRPSGDAPARKSNLEPSD